MSEKATPGHEHETLAVLDAVIVELGNAVQLSPASTSGPLRISALRRLPVGGRRFRSTATGG
jgi:hypothetical protein